MLKDYFMQMLTVTAPQMVRPFSPILPHSFQYFGGYLTNKWCRLVYTDMSSNTLPHIIV